MCGRGCCSLPRAAGRRPERAAGVSHRHGVVTDRTVQRPGQGHDGGLRHLGEDPRPARQKDRARRARRRDQPGERVERVPQARRRPQDQHHLSKHQLELGAGRQGVCLGVQGADRHRGRRRRARLSARSVDVQGRALRARRHDDRARVHAEERHEEDRASLRHRRLRPV